MLMKYELRFITWGIRRALQSLNRVLQNTVPIFICSLVRVSSEFPVDGQLAIIIDEDILLGPGFTEPIISVPSHALCRNKTCAHVDKLAGSGR